MLRGSASVRSPVTPASGRRLLALGLGLALLLVVAFPGCAGQGEDGGSDAGSPAAAATAPMEEKERRAVYAAIESFVGKGWNGFGLYPDPCGWSPIQVVHGQSFRHLLPMLANSKPFESQPVSFPISSGPCSLLHGQRRQRGSPRGARQRRHPHQRAPQPRRKRGQRWPVEADPSEKKKQRARTRRIWTSRRSQEPLPTPVAAGPLSPRTGGSSTAAGLPWPPLLDVLTPPPLDGHGDAMAAASRGSLRRRPLVPSPSVPMAASPAGPFSPCTGIPRTRRHGHRFWGSPLRRLLGARRSAMATASTLLVTWGEGRASRRSDERYWLTSTGRRSLPRRRRAPTTRLLLLVPPRPAWIPARPRWRRRATAAAA